MALWDNAACMELDRFLDSLGIRHSAPTLGTTIGSPPGHGHTAGSNHYREQDGGPKGSTGQARDYGTYGSDCEAIARAFEPFARGPNYVITELIWTRSMGFLGLFPSGIYYKRGVAYKPTLTLARQHTTHDHIALAVGKHLSGVPHPAPDQEDFMAALTPAEQRQMHDELHNLHEWSKPDGPWEKPDKDRLAAVEKAVGDMQALLLKIAQKIQVV